MKVPDQSHVHVQGKDRRYLVTLGSQLVRLILAGVTASIVPRALGPLQYGNYNFLVGTATSIHSFLDPSASHAFFTFSSSQVRTGSLSRIFAGVLATQLAIALTLVSVAYLGGWLTAIWPGQAGFHVAMVTTSVWLTFVATALQQLGDSKGLTLKAQLLGLISTASALVGVVVLAAVGALTFETMVITTGTAALLGCLLLGRFLLVDHHEQCWDGNARKDGGQVVRAWWAYARPLLSIEYCTPLVTFLSLYLVQTQYGPREQGYLSLATRWSALVVVFTSASLMIVWREVARHSATGDLSGASEVYRRFSSGLFCVTLVLCTLLSGLSPLLVAGIAGPDYAPAIPVVAIMAFYPLQQMAGQLTAAAFKATGRTIAYRNLGFLYFGFDLALVYFLLVPADAFIPGLGLGAVGVAIRLVVFGLIGVQLYERADARYFRFSYVQATLSKIRSIILVGAVAFATLRWAPARLLEYTAGSTVAAATIASILYLSIIGVIVFRWPEIMGLTRAHVEWSLDQLGLTSR